MTSSMKVELLWQRPAARWRERFSGTRLRARESVPPSSPGSCKEHAPRVTADLSRAWACPSTHSDLWVKFPWQPPRFPDQFASVSRIPPTPTVTLAPLGRAQQLDDDPVLISAAPSRQRRPWPQRRRPRSCSRSPRPSRGVLFSAVLPSSWQTADLLVSRERQYPGRYLSSIGRPSWLTSRSCMSLACSSSCARIRSSSTRVVVSLSPK